MLSSRSSVYKMLNTDTRDDRRISKFPRPFSRGMTPYQQNDFSKSVHLACSSYLPLMAGLKISKVIILGDVCVGKTSLVHRFCHRSFDTVYKATIGVDFEVERFEILRVPFNLQIWDTAGQERFKCIAAAYYRSAHAVIITFDLTNYKSLHNAWNWLKEALDSNYEKPIIFLVGTKFDLTTNSSYVEISDKAEQIASRMGAEYWAVSSKTGDGVDEMFSRVAALTFDRVVVKDIDSIDNRQFKMGDQVFNLSKTNNTPKKSKCGGKLGNCSK